MGLQELLRKIKENPNYLNQFDVVEPFMSDHIEIDGVPVCTIGDVLEYAAGMQAELYAESEQLEKWAAESQRGGWSTHQVKPQLARAQEIRLLLAGGIV